jgi:hypothetical protein
MILNRYPLRPACTRSLRKAQTYGAQLFVVGFVCRYTLDAVAAEEPAVRVAQTMPDGQFAIHEQATYVEQETDSFTAPYAEPNSLSPDSGRESVDATRERFLNAGGLDIPVGDGQLPHPGAEQIVETYDSFAVRLHRLESSNIEDSDRVEVLAALSAERRSDGVLERIVGRLAG